MTTNTRILFLFISKLVPQKYQTKIEMESNKSPLQKQGSQDYNRLFHDARIAYQKENFIKAATLFAKAHELQPQSIQNLNYLGLCYLASKDYEQAVRIFEQYYSTKPDLLSLLNIGLANHKLHRLEEALKAYQKAQKLHPDHYKIFAKIGDVLYDMNRYEEALKVTNKALVLWEKQSQNQQQRRKMLNLKGLLLMELDKVDEAIQLYQGMIGGESDKDSVLLIFNLGHCYQIKQHYQQALRLYDQCLKMTPDDPKIYFRKGKVYEMQGDLEEALLNHNQALRLDDMYAPAHASRVSLRSRIGDSSQIYSDIQTTQSIVTNTESFSLDEKEVLNRQLDKTRDLCEKIRDSEPDNKEMEKTIDSFTSSNCLALSFLIEHSTINRKLKKKFKEMIDELMQKNQVLTEIYKNVNSLRESHNRLKDRVGSLEEKLDSLIEKRKEDLYPELEIEAELTRIGNNKNIYFYVVTLHKLINSYFQTMWLLQSGLLQENNKGVGYQSMLAKVGTVFTKIGSIAQGITGLPFTSIADKLTKVYNYYDYQKRQETKDKVKEITKYFVSQRDLCHHVLSSIFKMLDLNPDKKRMIQQCHEQLQKLKSQKKSAITSVKELLSERISDLKQELNKKVFGIERKKQDEETLVSCMATYDFTTLIEYIHKTPLSHIETSLKPLITHHVCRPKTSIKCTVGNEELFLGRNGMLTKKEELWYIEKQKKFWILVHKNSKELLTCEKDRLTSSLIQNSSSLEFKQIFTIINVGENRYTVRRVVNEKENGFLQLGNPSSGWFRGLFIKKEDYFISVSEQPSKNEQVWLFTNAQLLNYLPGHQQ